MKIYYISPSIIPSRSANSIHVMSMCDALNQSNARVVLFAYSNSLNSKSCAQKISDFYDVNIDGIDIDIYHSSKQRGVEFAIAARSLIRFFIDWLKGDSPQIIISRNLYSALFLGVILRKKIIYETHSPEYGMRKVIQFCLLKSNKIKTVVISNALKKVICDFHSVEGDQIYVFHDAAKAGKAKINDIKRDQIKEDLIASAIDLKRYKKLIGYFGHLYSGRGIEVIKGVAELNPSYAVVVYGGNEKEIIKYRCTNNLDNLCFI